MFRWLTGRGARDAAVSDMDARITAAQWQWVLDTHGFLQELSDDDKLQLRARIAWFLASKTINGAAGFELNDEVRLSIAAQACLPILHLEPSRYEGWHEVIVYPGGFLIPRTEVDDDGVVHEYVQEAAGEAWEGGPLILSWEDADPMQEADGGYAFNVVIHEFAHKLDLADGGGADGMPGLHAHPDISPRVWMRVLDASYDAFRAQLDAVEAAIPPDVDPESADADEWWDTLPLDPYAATDPAEFFAVSSEAFFVHPEPLADAMPEWYALLKAFYRQDTVARRRPAMAGRALIGLPPGADGA
jgi:Mlc titration factor MtfA (ptsG expression regulator)